MVFVRQGNAHASPMEARTISRRRMANPVVAIRITLSPAVDVSGIDRIPPFITA
jgi:hypothetical protein